MAKQVMPEANLEVRATDVPLSNEEFLQLSLFAALKSKPSLDRFPGALRLRHYQAGEVICRQGEAGRTAFFLLTSADELLVREAHVPSSWKGEEGVAWREAMERLRMRLQHPRVDDEEQQIASAHLTVGQAARKERGWLARALDRFSPGHAGPARPTTIVVDGARDFDAETMQAPLREGELVGEMSCLYGTPNSSTVVAMRDCFALEMLRNILDIVQKDPAYRARTDEIYKKRVLQMHLRRLSLLSDLTDEQFQAVRERVELVSYTPGQVIFDEHERPDSMYLIRRGLVRVLKKASSLLHEQDVRDWGQLCQALTEGEGEADSPAGVIWQSLGAKARALAAKGGTSLTPDERRDLLFALNDRIIDPALRDAKPFQTVLSSTAFREKCRPPAGRPKDWTDRESRRVNRRLVEAAFPGALRELRQRVGPDCVLSYLSAGDFIGEMGLVSGQPRSATCLAHGHPLEGAGQAKDSSRVELVRLPAAVFQEILNSVPAVREKVEQRVAERLKATNERGRSRVWDQGGHVLLSDRAEKLGLVQGQRLMLIDLERCTRCDQCVKACASTHDDGRSRLFLDGPRLGNYLVPATCRSCLDPVCMIGCPVGSIHRGNNNQMVIEDWCIGCGLCAKQCPYGSVQMHDIGIIPENAPGWRYLPAATVKHNRWFRPGYRDHGWLLGDPPFRPDRSFRTNMSDLAKSAADGPAAVCFRYTFRLAAELLGPDRQFKLEVTAPDPEFQLWVNGQELHADTQKGGKREYRLPPKPAVAEAPAAKPAPAARKSSPAMQMAWKGQKQTPPPPPAKPVKPAKAAAAPVPQVLRAGRNVVAVRVAPHGDGDLLFQLRLDAIPRATGPSELFEELTQKLVTDRAVVCDLCSSLPGQVPACVNVCPHDAAMRVDASLELPGR